ncbi:TPA: hypothetical protein ACQ7WR_004361 [Escherichia coli]
MKRILPLILALVAGMAQADSNSDYRAGSDFAHQIKGQGSSSIQGFKPQESIPGYNANPDETKYYGGVTAGGDGGLKNDGTTEWATGETGKTITESFMNKPKDILSPDAPFIQTGRDVVNRADSIVGNTGQQCSAQEISRSEYTNYTCERDLQVATPTTFLVNVNTLEALPLLQGATDAAGFMARMDTVLQMYGGKKGAK